MEKFSAKSTFKDIRNFLAGRFLGATRDEFFLEEIVKIVFCKYEILNMNTDDLDDCELSGLYRETFGKVINKYYEIYSDKKYELELDPISIKYIDRKLNDIDLLNIERDIIGDAYEIFMGDAIKGQSGQFFTPQNVAEALVEMIDPKVNDKVLDLACGAGGFLVATIKHLAKTESLNSTKKFISSNLYGIDKDNYLRRLAMIHVACIGKTSAKIKCEDSLIWNEEVLGKAENAYDVIVTNPPFGVNIQTGSVETLSKYELAYKHKRSGNGDIKIISQINESVPPQVVFVERCIRLIKPGGKIGIVVPESMISNKKYTYVNEFILRTCTIKAIIGMPDELFKTSGKGGTHTKTCLMILEKNIKRSKEPYNIFMAEAKWCGHDSRGRAIPNDDIPQIVKNYIIYNKKRQLEKTKLGYLVPTDKLENTVLAPRSYIYTIENKYSGMDENYDFVSIGKLIDKGIIELSTGNEIGKLAYGTGDIPFIRTSDISNWEIKSDPKHLVSEEIYNKYSEKQDVREGDILMVKDGTYLIGTCAIVTKCDTKILYQSHLYKIRVHKNNEYGINSYYMLAVLSSHYIKEQIFSKTYSQDIINSLGDRLKELIIPIPKKMEKINKISQMVNEAIYKSIEARKLAKEARNEILI